MNFWTFLSEALRQNISEPRLFFTKENIFYRGGSGFILRAQAFSGLKNLLTKLCLIRVWLYYINEKVRLRLWVLLSEKPEPDLGAQAQARPTSNF
jgi:hypothetical protein